MKHYRDEWIEEWCHENGWTDVCKAGSNLYWAFPPGAVMPEPIPSPAMKLIKANKGLSFEERVWSIAAIIITILAGLISYCFRCPMPLVFAFAFAAVTVAQMEVEDV